MSAPRPLTSRIAHDYPVVAPVLGVVVLLLTWGRDLGAVPVAVVAVVLVTVVLAAVHHAEVIAHRVGEPFGSLVLAVAVTVIEVGLILTLMVSGGDKTATLARDTVFAAAMITMNGIVGLSLVAGALRHGVPRFNAEGAGSALATVLSVATLSLVLPNFTTSSPGAQFSGPQLAFAAVGSAALWLIFVLTQTGRHREFFLPVTDDLDPPGLGPDLQDELAAAEEAGTPTRRRALVSLWLLLLALVAVVGLAKVESPAIEDGVAAAGFPQSFVGVVIALVVLLPETLASVRAARRNLMQTSLNLAYGSAMASIGLTVPAIAVASIWLEGPLVLGLGPVQMVLLLLTAVVSVLTLVPGRATRLEGAVHLTLFAAFVFLSINP
ncbi:calcium:proton antiporter [Nocardioides mesophilus]|uniref:Ionic transporter y4hA n=1 Tax=Nocardioides mesophilus TaxID=433659 RepID=A0A7G9R6J5_9ACTN|nr:ionic transporter y4hA [Nocardioides mesophilus]QNN51220.1 ionic transporter y4hA [Nocardioides mesophilus]